MFCLALFGMKYNCLLVIDCLVLITFIFKTKISKNYGQDTCRIYMKQQDF